MKSVLPEKLEVGRVRHGYFGSGPDNGPYGAFFVSGPCGCELKIIASGADETGWEHVSVSTPRRPPNWQEMCFVKDLFWEPEECVMQLHPPASQYVNNHPHCLHMWRPIRETIPLPPAILVGVKALGVLGK
jgi:hypothetical protein